ncbi:hypothetical protein HY487_01275 [Candidatus Woesearchaeota archaeon]|nr:hypothetical protein [Candidatus Woesearchaeota archaeon]
MHNLVDRLEKKGWERKEIIKAVEAIKNAKKSKPKDVIFIEKQIFWILLAIIIAANFAVSVALLPLLVALNGVLLYSAVTILGIVFGLLFELVIRGMDHLEKKHHFFLAILIPVVAMSNVFIVSRMSNSLVQKFGFANSHNPIFISVAYSASFALPYVISRFVLKIGYYSKN